MIDSGELIKNVLNELVGFCVKNHIKILKTDDKIIMYLDDSGDNIIVWKPEIICIPCIHPDEQRSARMELNKQ